MHAEKTMRCKKCEGATRLETATDMLTGLRVRQYVCFSCELRWCADCAEEPHSLPAAA